MRSITVLPLLAALLAASGPQAIPPALQPHVAALGDQAASKISTGVLRDARGKETPLRIISQRLGIVRVEGLAFNGDSREDANILETFTDDTFEGLLAAVERGGALHLVGRNVLADIHGRQEARIPRLDIFEISAPVSTSRTGLQRLKRYSFDSATGLLANTQYVDDTVSPAMNVEIRFSDWRRLDGFLFPALTERLENGYLVFSFTR
jgi:hypothetical protein